MNFLRSEKVFKEPAIIIGNDEKWTKLLPFLVIIGVIYREKWKTKNWRLDATKEGKQNVNNCSWNNLICKLLLDWNFSPFI